MKPAVSGIGYTPGVDFPAAPAEGDSWWYMGRLWTYSGATWRPVSSPGAPFWWAAPGSGTALTSLGIALPTVTGTATARAPGTAGTVPASLRRTGYTTAAAAGSLAGIRSAAAFLWRGNAAGRGGFFLRWRIIPTDAAVVAGERSFCGLGSAAAPTNVEPTTLTNVVGVCQLSTSNNWHLITNDAAGVATTTDLGGNYPANTLSTDAYELLLYCPANGAAISWRFERLWTAFVASGVLTADLPVATTMMALQLWRTNNATALAAAIDSALLYGETDY
jgi:hypothetical protein